MSAKAPGRNYLAGFQSERLTLAAALGPEGVREKGGLDGFRVFISLGGRRGQHKRPYPVLKWLRQQGPRGSSLGSASPSLGSLEDRGLNRPASLTP